MPSSFASALCQIHGSSLDRRACTECNAAYMREYLRRRRLEQPAKELWSRARKRAQKRGVPFTIQPDGIVLPKQCPVIGIPLVVGGGRSSNSPSLDRIDPLRGYVAGNVRVICDYANRLKSNLSPEELAFQSEFGTDSLRRDYRRICAYVEREMLLAVAARNALFGRGRKSEWKNVADFIEKVCIYGFLDPDETSD